MQTINLIDDRQSVISNLTNKIKISSVRSNNSKVNLTQPAVNCGTTDYNTSFNFKYVTEAELQAIVKRVRRTRQKKQDEEKWQKFLRWNQSEVAENSSDNGVCQRCVLAEGSHCPTQAHIEFSQSQDHRKDMPKVEEDEVQGSLITSTILGASVTENINQAFQLGGVLTKRLQDLVTTVGRMTSLLLSSVTTRSAQYEDEDVDRAIKRSVEFDAMFTRNHLYEIQRLLKDAKQLAAGKSPRGELESKISAALKCVTQAIQVYAKHVSKGARVKYQQVVPIFQSILKIHSLLEQLTGQRVFPFRQELEVSCSYMKQLLLEMSTTDTQSVTTVSRKPARSKPPARHKPSADLSMYNRRRADWRRKTASFARAKFGPPSGKNQKNKPDSVSEKGILDKNKADFNENESQQHHFKVTENRNGPVKEPVNAKEVPYRNATRAVPEDNVTTMMEMIPNEFYNGKCNGNMDFVEKIDKNDAKPSSSNCTFSFSLKSHSSDKRSLTGSKPASARSVKGEPNNVQLICLKEEENPKPNPSDYDIPAVNNSDIQEDSRTTLTIKEQTKTEALEYHQKMVEYHKRNSHYKDGKALGIVDRLATRILTEMFMDFQKEEMNNVIQTLYSLEFQ